MRRDEIGRAGQLVPKLMEQGSLSATCHKRKVLTIMNEYSMQENEHGTAGGE